MAVVVVIAVDEVVVVVVVVVVVAANIQRFPLGPQWRKETILVPIGMQLQVFWFYMLLRSYAAVRTYEAERILHVRLNAFRV